VGVRAADCGAAGAGLAIDGTSVVPADAVQVRVIRRDRHRGLSNTERDAAATSPQTVVRETVVRDRVALGTSSRNRAAEARQGEASPAVAVEHVPSDGGVLNATLQAVKVTVGETIVA